MRSCHHEQLIWQGVPRLQRGALSPTGSRHVVLRANFDRQFTGQSVKVKVPKVKVSCIEIGVQGSGKFFPLGQAKKW
jgi:hypothetical protein